MSGKKLKVIELFSGIGSQAKALKNINVDFEVINTCEWNIHALMAYACIHGFYDEPDDNKEMSKEEMVAYLGDLGVSNDGKEPMNAAALKAINEEALQMICKGIRGIGNLVDVSKIKGDSLPDDIDILTYSFPCQDLSNVGAFHGYNTGIDRDAHNRSGLLWEVERILIERHDAELFMPHFLLMENVPALDSKRHRKNFEEWKSQLNKLGYYNQQYLLNAKDFGLPQNRERLLMISVYTDGDPDVEDMLKRYFAKHDLSDEDYRRTLGIEKPLLNEYLRTDYSQKKYMEEALLSQPNNTVSRMKIWDNNVQLTDLKGNVKDIVTSTLTTKQDRHPNSGNLWVDFNNGKANFRYLTPRECFLLMGFSEDDYDKVIAGNFKLKKNSKIFTRDNLIKMAGNSIAVKVLEHVFKQIVDIDQLIYI